MSRLETTVDQVLVALRRIVRAIDVHSHRLVIASVLAAPQLLIMNCHPGLMEPENLDATRIPSSGPLGLTGHEILEVLPDDTPLVPGVP